MNNPPMSLQLFIVALAVIMVVLLKQAIELIHLVAVSSRRALEPGIYATVFVCRLPGIHGLNKYDVGVVPVGLNSRPRQYRMFVDGVRQYDGPPLLVVRVGKAYGRETYLWLPRGIRLEMANVELDERAEAQCAA